MHTKLLNELSLKPSDWRNYLRIEEDSYFELLTVVTVFFKKKTGHFDVGILYKNSKIKSIKKKLEK